MFRVAVIGLGSMGSNHARVLRSLPGVELAAVCDVEPGAGHPEPIYRSVEELLARERLDAAVVAVPTMRHKEVALACIRRGVSLLVEKPIAATVADGREIAAAARAAGVRVAVGHVERFNPAVRALRRELESRDVWSINITRVGPIPPRVMDVGVLIDLSVHDIDLIRFLTGCEIRRKAIFSSGKTLSRREDNAILAFELDRGIIANITTNWLTPFKKRTIEVATRECYYEADLMTQRLLEYSAFRVDSSYVTRHCRVQSGEPLVNEHQAFLSYVQTGEIGSLASLDDAVRTLEVLED